jgi:hypothetical protein
MSKNILNENPMANWKMRLFLLFILIGTTSMRAFTQSKTTIPPSQDVNSKTNTTQTKKIDFKLDQPFQIIYYKRGITDQSTAKDTNMCKGWTLSEKDLIRTIKDSKIIGGTEWDLSFEVLPCIISGQLKQNGKLYDFQVNGGSWTYIRAHHITIILGNYKKEDEKYFLEGHNPD